MNIAINQAIASFNLPRWIIIMLLALVTVVIGIKFYPSAWWLAETTSSEEIIVNTPTTHPNDFENIRNSKAKRHVQTGEIWEPDLLHKDHWEVYKNQKNWEKGKRDRAIWNDGRHKEKF